MTSKYDQREQDWRMGAVVYQVLVDRYAPSADLEAKKRLNLYDKGVPFVGKLLSASLDSTTPLVGSTSARILSPGTMALPGMT